MISSADHLKLLIEKLKLNQSIQITAYGYSMYPSIKNGTKLSIHPMPIAQIKNGMILMVINAKGDLLIHRLCFHHQSQYYLKGDALPRFDDVISSDCIYGVVTAYQNPPQNKDQETFQKINLHWYARYFWIVLSILIGGLKLLKDLLR
jgi:hypothetical protein